MQKFLSEFEKKIYFWLFLGVLIFVPLYPKFPLLGIPLTYVSIRLEDVFIAFGFGLALLIQIPRMKRLFKMSIIHSFSLYWFIGLVSLLSAIFITYTVSPHLGFLHWLRRIEYMSLFFMAITAISNLKQVKIILITFVLVTFVICLYGFGQQWLDFPVVSTTNREFSKGQILTLTSDARVNSTFAGHYDLAIYLSMVLSLLSAMFFYYPIRTGKKWNLKGLISRGVVATIALLSFLLLGMTAARLSFVATMIGIITSLALNKKWLLIVAFMFMAVGTIAVIPELRHRLVATLTVNILGGGGAKYTPETNGETDPAKRLTPEERKKIFDTATASGELDPEKTSNIASDLAPGEPINTTELGVYRSFKIRSDVEWPRAYRAFLRNPLLGTGYSSLGIATDNDLLRVLGEVGILGATSLGLIFVIVFKKLWKQYKQSLQSTDLKQSLQSTDLKQSFSSSDVENKSQNRLSRYFAVGMLAMVVGFLINSLFIDVFEASKVATLFWAFLGINWRLAGLAQRQTNG